MSFQRPVFRFFDNITWHDICISVVWLLVKLFSWTFLTLDPCQKNELLLHVGETSSLRTYSLRTAQTAKKALRGHQKTPVYLEGEEKAT